MIELWLNFTDDKGEPKRVLVEGEKFAIGRTPDNDLQIPVSNLSREHAQIQRFADVFVVSDMGSSNGTSLNGEKLEKPVGLKNGDKLDLGGLEMEVEIVSDKAGADDSKGSGGGGDGSASNEDEDEDEQNSQAASAGAGSASAGSTSKSESSLAPLLFIAAPIFGIIVLLLLGGLFLISRGNNGTQIVKTNKNTDFIRSNDNEEKDPPTNQESGGLGKGNSSTPTTSTPPTNSSNVPPTPISTEEVPVTPPPPTSETEKIGKNSNAFLRLIAQNDPRAFLTDKQIALLNSRITPFKRSTGLAENIRNAKKNAAQIQSLAASKDLKPQFLVNAALTKLGTQPGDVVATAREMLDQLSAISKPFGNETADDNLLIIAAYSGNTSGESLQNTAGGYTKTNPGSARTIRSIWFFKDKGKLSNDQFEFALRYLVIGTITQNPKDFDVQAEALTF